MTLTSRISDTTAASQQAGNNAIFPPSTLGILGGGQLGRMIALKAREMGYGIVTLDPTPNSPCAQVADEQVLAPFDSVEGAIRLAEKSDVLTYEFENIGPEVAHHLENISDMPQGYRLLYTTQNRLREKKAIEEAGVQVAPYHKVENETDLQSGIEQIGYPGVLKTTEGGYDGKGQLVLRSTEQLTTALNMLQKANQPLVLEKWLPFEKEISIIVARNRSGELSTFPIAENIHRENILHASIVPARITEQVQRQALTIAEKLATAFQLVGLLAIEMFVLKDGTVIVNELAPRPHNSGHYTQQGCLTSQFEQHVRAICNLPLGRTALVRPTVMVNILGEDVEQAIKHWPTTDSEMKIHLYGKEEAKPKRKMGHMNVSAETLEQAIQKINDCDIWKPIE